MYIKVLYFKNISRIYEVFTILLFVEKFNPINREKEFITY